MPAGHHREIKHPRGILRIKTRGGRLPRTVGRGNVEIETVGRLGRLNGPGNQPRPTGQRQHQANRPRVKGMLPTESTPMERRGPTFTEGQKGRERTGAYLYSWAGKGKPAHVTTAAASRNYSAKAGSKGCGSAATGDGEKRETGRRTKAGVAILGGSRHRMPHSSGQGAEKRFATKTQKNKNTPPKIAKQFLPGNFKKRQNTPYLFAGDCRRDTKSPRASHLQNKGEERRLTSSKWSRLREPELQDAWPRAAQVPGKGIFFQGGGPWGGGRDREHTPGAERHADVRPRGNRRPSGADL